MTTSTSTAPSAPMGSDASPTVPARIVALPVHGWRLISRWLPPHCRFYPSCSAYGVQAVRQYGAVCGGWLTMRRVLRCHPWNPGGFDPVPPNGRTALPADHDESAPPVRRVA